MVEDCKVETQMFKFKILFTKGYFLWTIVHNHEALVVCSLPGRDKLPLISHSFI
jgi:hypothetical protein